MPTAADPVIHISLCYVCMYIPITLVRFRVYSVLAGAGHEQV